MQQIPFFDQLPYLDLAVPSRDFELFEKVQLPALPHGAS